MATVKDSESREVVFSGAELEVLEDALDHHEETVSDGDAGRVTDLESYFEVDLDEGDDGRFELARADARVVVSALERYDALASGEEEDRLEELREELISLFEFDEGPLTEPEAREDEQYPGST
ncbi:MAG: hypothetical protein ABEH47_00820 [Haloferacaceae archaeon]